MTEIGGVRAAGQAESQAFPRNVAVRSLEKCLLDAAQKAGRTASHP